MIVGDQEGVVVVPSDLINKIAYEIKNMTIYEYYVLSQVKKGRTIKGLYPLTNKSKEKKFNEWLTKNKKNIEGG